MNNFDCFDTEESKFHPPVESPDSDIRSHDLTNKVLYPNLFLEINGPMPGYRIQVLKSMLEKIPFIHDKVLDNYYDVYLKTSENLICLGMVHTDNLKTILQSSLYSEIKKTLKLSPREYVEGAMMYAFCTSPMYE